MPGETTKDADLWGPPFEEEYEETAPIVLLRQQAEFLTDRTKGRLVGEVVVRTEGGTVWASLYARVPAMKDYSHKLISLAYPVASAREDHPFPLSVFDEDGDADEVKDETAFKKWLSKVLQSLGMRNVIRMLQSFPADRAAS